MRGATSVVLLACLAVTAFSVPAEPCDEEACHLPNCHCSSTETPGGLSVSELPHFVVLSFDDGVTVSNHPFYLELGEFTNPNGCKISMTFFVSHENSDYTLVNDLYRRHHEIAVHSVTHKADVENYWRKLDKDGWLQEMQDEVSMLSKYAKVPSQDIKGWRAPFLEVGGNEMYQALSEAGFEYDCSWPSLQYTPWFQQADGTVNGALWPYTLDYHSKQDHTIGTKPDESFPGLWVSPMTDLQDNRGVECSMVDACQSANDELETSAAAVTDMLKRNFRAHINTRTPFGVYVHHSWFVHDDLTGTTARKDGFKGFLQYLKAFPEVFVVSAHQLIEWSKHPKSYDKLGELAAFQCKDTSVNTDCRDTIDCEFKEPLPINNTVVRMKICDSVCPTNYPYLNNVDGLNGYGSN